MLTRHRQVPLAPEELLGGGEAHRPLVACLVRGFGFFSSLAGSIPRTCSHIHCCTPVSWSQPYRTEVTHPPTLALAHDLARRGRQRFTAVQVLPDEVEAALPRRRPHRAPGRIDLLQLLAPLPRHRPR
ncbi:hypothetical protein [Streptomyces chryseus]|uniref:hypothetical protein n=1 Tax=Streptomyces chryseus TaxID=68186 RepID=UPI00142F2509|nr:hypothetical protein [Streptomyces chryseus]